ncbi:hypothetical protein TBLA_0E00470 [Henningerozyma blattae CBS 6284]|uniref:Transcription factor CBF/NF-Y/archaeal histone domain-containing protein n=1 Tax=Henningerozyma blattae (strain ATCC 34711 / CBS 6284 / DSM 70876 / NBRC 10599 / NRRL Y-10934 / UCD 77-7) TaxID=1071380 RepID=I2H406_HENB6|nr:hypothetical protein TBLA_0E00470 [Tetrapisispora blattae CBS 6284]CCH61108.1 hypothetical protein TBLA_0E00470 [Tetrapisispora blattae CBS 6284]
MSNSSNKNTTETDVKLPENTIARILQTSSFVDENTRITKNTVTKLQKYMELFIREAALRSLENKEEQISNEKSAVKNEPGLEDTKIFNDNNKLNDNDIELSHEALEAITGLLLLDM